MMKHDVKDILKYIEESITGRGVVVAAGKEPRGYGNKITFAVDSHTGDIIISITGETPRIGKITGLGGSKPTIETIVSGKYEVLTPCSPETVTLTSPVTSRF